ncbi:MAG: DEAD/DEAH box helicase [Actinomycetota bacterium]
MGHRTTAEDSARGPSGRPVDEFEQSYGFSFDPFQRRACDVLLDGSSVLVAAPTGAGKTVVGEFAAWLALERGGRTFYTTPIKALSNQKYADFVGLHGASNVGLLTGDNSVNGDAPIVVMTTEVLRNMIYEDSEALEDLHHVVLDEVHYLQDRYRGAVWEEVLIHLPIEVQTISLSATVSNAEEFGAWLQTLRGRVEVIIEEERPVEIRHWYLASDELLPMFVFRPDGSVMPNPRGREFDRRRRRAADRPDRGGRRTREKRPRAPLRVDVVDRLDQEKMLPAIYFIFSRRGCDEAVGQCVRDNVRLTTADERREIHRYAHERAGDLPADELAVLGYDEWVDGLASGIAAHHAGLIPPFKETVEELFKRGLVKAVFATETLALGINMPARSIVIESLMKFSGEKHELLTPGEYTQLSGRAGRRGIDELGHAVVLLQRFASFDTITRLASTRTYPLQSSFQPSYNMAVNLVRNYDQEEAEHLVNSSFAQYQADRDVVQLEQTKERLEAYHASYLQKLDCHLGDFRSYAELVEELKGLEGKRGDGRARGRVLDAIGTLVPGDVIDVTGGKRKGRYAVLEVTQRRAERRPRLLALSKGRAMVRFSPTEFLQPPLPVARLRLPPGFDLRDAGARRALARSLAGVTAPPRAQPLPAQPEDSVAVLRARMESHPCHPCPELRRHLHFAKRAARLDKEMAGLDRRMGRRTRTLARRFELVGEVLRDMRYIERWELSDKGESLRRVYNECDLLIVEALERRLFDPLDPAELAAVLSTVVYEARGPEVEIAAHMPSTPSRQAWSGLMRLWASIREREEAGGLELTREPDPGFAERAHAWASGAPLDEVLEPEDAPGDFVRSVKQLVDLLRQLETIVAPSELRSNVHAAVSGLHRGVVAYSSWEL